MATAILSPGTKQRMESNKQISKFAKEAELYKKDFFEKRKRVIKSSVEDLESSLNSIFTI